MERRTVYIAIASVLAAAGVGLLVLALPASRLLIFPGTAFIGCAALLFSSLLVGWPLRSLSTRPSDTGPPYGVIGEQPLEGRSEAPPALQSLSMEMYRLSPSSWLGQVGQERPELSLRVVVALPGPASVHTGEVATQIRGQAREEWLISALEQSSLSDWLRSQRRIWQWTGDPVWEVRGSGMADFTELVYEPFRGQLRPPLVARCGVITGHRAAHDGLDPAIQVAFDLMLNVLELDANRLPSQIRHATDPPPAPGAVRPEELAEVFLELFAAARFAQGAAKGLLGDPGLETGRVAAFLDVSGVEFDRVVRMTGLRRLMGAIGVGDHVRVDAWPLPAAEPPMTAVGTFVADFMDELLERAGYRDAKDLFAFVRRSAPT